jgi:hypothetical protein
MPPKSIRQLIGSYAKQLKYIPDSGPSGGGHLACHYDRVSEEHLQHIRDLIPVAEEFAPEIELPEEPSMPISEEHSKWVYRVCRSLSALL